MTEKYIKSSDVIEILQRAQMYAKDSGLGVVQNELHNIEVSVGWLPRVDVVEKEVNFEESKETK